MTDHNFKIGQFVYFHPKSRVAAGAPSGPYQITRRLPASDGEFSVRDQKRFRRSRAHRRRKRAEPHRVIRRRSPVNDKWPKPAD